MVNERAVALTAELDLYLQTALPVDHFARLLIPGDFDHKPLAICTGFGGGVSPVTLVAAFFGTAADWRGCERDWNETLNEFGFAPRRALSEGILEHKLRALGAVRRKAFVQQLATLIGDHGIFGRATFIRSDDLAGLALEDDAWMEIELLKHNLCLEECFNEVFDVVESYFPNRDMAFIFKSSVYDIDILRIYDRNRINNHKTRKLTQLKNIMFSSKDEFSALQVMDILAYSIYLSCSLDDVDQDVHRKWVSFDLHPLAINVIEIDPRALRETA